MENMRLETNKALQELGMQSSSSILLDEFTDTITLKTEDLYKNNGFSKFTCKGKYIYTSAKGDDFSTQDTHLGQMRISFENDPCSTATIMA